MTRNGTTTLSLPFPPTSNNAFATVNGRRVKSAAARQYAATVMAELMLTPAAQELRRHASKDQRYSVSIDVHAPDRRKRDLANQEKLVVDAIFGWLGIDDSQVDKLTLKRCQPVSQGQLIIRIGGQA